jgi:hypothetical protein
MQVNKQEQQTIEDYVNKHLEFKYIETTCKYLNIKYNDNIIDKVLDDYNRLVKTQDKYNAKVNSLRIFAIRAKFLYSQQYTDYEELE